MTATSKKKSAKKDSEKSEEGGQEGPRKETGWEEEAG
jgi:hypothetical protein